LPRAHLARADKDGDGFTDAQRLFQPGTPWQARCEMPTVQKWLETFITQLLRDAFHDLMIG
jgi:hypothetical protein